MIESEWALFGMIGAFFLGFGIGGIFCSFLYDIGHVKEKR